MNVPFGRKPDVRSRRTATAIDAVTPSMSIAPRPQISPSMSSPANRSCLHPDLFEIELALDVPEDMVVDGAAVARRAQRVALGVDHVTADRPVLAELLLGLVARRLVELLLVLRAMPVARPELIDQRFVIGPLLLQLIDSAERLLNQLLACVRLLVALIAVAPQAERPDDERQRQTLTDERHEDDREGNDDDRVARRQRIAGQRDGEGERRRERDHAAHARPRQDEGLSKSGAPLIVRQQRAKAHPDDPERADSDERNAHEDAHGGELEERGAIHLSGDARDL